MRNGDPRSSVTLPSAETVFGFCHSHDAHRRTGFVFSIPNTKSEEAREKKTRRGERDEGKRLGEGRQERAGEAKRRRLPRLPLSLEVPLAGESVRRRSQMKLTGDSAAAEDGAADCGGGRTVVVGVKLDPRSRELLTWALVKVAEPGDHVIALHVLDAITGLNLFLSQLRFWFWFGYIKSEFHFWCRGYRIASLSCKYF